MNHALRVTTIMLLSLSLTGCTLSEVNSMKHKNISLNGQIIDATLAETPQEQQKGLGGINSLAENEGMFFPLSQVSVPIFWMKDMKISIDMLWIFKGKVVGIEPSVKIDDGQRLYSPTQPIDSVLELPAGWALRHGTSIGDSIE